MTDANQAPATGRGIYYLSTSSTGTHFRIRCNEWTFLSLQQKLAVASSIMPRNPAHVVSRVNAYCAVILPAGQADDGGDSTTADLTITQDESTAYDIANPLPATTTTDNTQQLIEVPGETIEYGSGGTTTSSGGGLTTQQGNAILGGIGNTLAGVGTAIGAFMTGQSQLQTAQLNAQTQTELATIRNQGAGIQNTSALQIAGLQANTWLWIAGIVGAVTVVGIGGFVWYSSTQSTKPASAQTIKKNPRRVKRIKGRRR